MLVQVNELTMDAWYGRSFGIICFSNTLIEYRGVSQVHQRLTASAWIIKLNEVLNPHCLAADLCEKSTYHIRENESPTPRYHGHKNNGPKYIGTTDIDLQLRLFLWSARAAQAAPQPTQCRWRCRQAPRAGTRSPWWDPTGSSTRRDRAGRADAGPILRVSCTGAAATAPPTQTMPR